MDSKIVLTIAVVAIGAFALLTASTLVATNVFSQNASNAANQTKASAGAAMNKTSGAAKNATQGAGAALNQTGKTISNTANNMMQGLKNLFSGGNNTKK
ncbi:MAG TPA: hypothetical protein VN703_00550 [Candidatus Sulfopaludibacter sp.]|jgi:hypothetical protein|nr:hypothetical protein [Candidatus Sulfopaludibacter sp.]